MKNGIKYIYKNGLSLVYPFIQSLIGCMSVVRIHISTTASHNYKLPIHFVYMKFRYKIRLSFLIKHTKIPLSLNLSICVFFVYILVEFRMLKILNC